MRLYIDSLIYSRTSLVRTPLVPFQKSILWRCMSWFQGSRLARFHCSNLIAVVGVGLLCVHIAWYMLSCLSVFSDLNQAPFSTSVEHHSNVGYELLGRQGSGQYSFPVCRLHQWWEWVGSSFDTSCPTQLLHYAVHGSSYYVDLIFTWYFMKVPTYHQLSYLEHVLALN